MNTNDTPKPFYSKFLPGVLLGTVAGSLGVAFLTPIALTWWSLPPDPVARGPRIVEPTTEVASVPVHIEGR